MSKRQIIAISLIFFRMVQSMQCGSNLINVYTNTTTYVGCEAYNWKGELFRAFQGIRYVKAPINELRFQDPRRVEYEFNSVDCRNGGKDCPSIFTENASEDCLFLNVFSKSVQTTNTSRPVLVFIHPGGFYGGTGASTFLGPEYLLEKDIVLVTFNYRLGSLGFLNLGTPDVPGNAGLKDQVFALRWTRDNIKYFGGDPNDITLIGYSAGAFSVCLHLVSPMSQGLFHKAIIMSGSIPPQTTIPINNQIELAKMQALVMGCKEPILNPNDIIQCLNRFSGLEIAKTLRQMFSFGKDNPIFLWLPVIEQDFGQERFLTEDPYVSLQAGRFARVPILIGFTSGEFCTSAQEIITNDVLKNKFNNEFETLAPICFMYYNHSKENEITRAIRSQYFHNSTVDESLFKPLCDLFSDSLIRFGVQKISSLASKYVSVYPYRFSYRGRVSYLNYSRIYAVEHMDDLLYLFQMPIAKFSPGDPEASIVELIINFVTKFAINGKPEQDFEYKVNRLAEIDSRISIKNGPHFENYTFWNHAIKY